MRKFLLLALLSVPAVAQTTTYTGTVKDLTGTCGYLWAHHVYLEATWCQ